VTRVLGVDDEPALARAVAINLPARHHDVDVDATGAAALRLAADKHPDVVLLDLGLPDMDGTEVIAGLHGWTPVPTTTSPRRSVWTACLPGYGRLLEEAKPHPTSRLSSPGTSPSTWPPTKSCARARKFGSLRPRGRYWIFLSATGAWSLSASSCGKCGGGSTSGRRTPCVRTWATSDANWSASAGRTMVTRCKGCRRLSPCAAPATPERAAERCLP